MNFSFQTFLVGAVVTAAHVGILVAFKPASMEASKYFSNLEMDAFVEEVLVKKGAEPHSIEVASEATVAQEEESVPESIPEEAMILARGEEATESAGEIDISEERDSMKAVTNVRAFAGRVEEPALIRAEKVESKEPPVEAPVAAPEPQASEKVPPPKKTGPFEVRAIQPVPRRS